MHQPAPASIGQRQCDHTGPCRKFFQKLSPPQHFFNRARRTAPTSATASDEQGKRYGQIPTQFGTRYQRCHGSRIRTDPRSDLPRHGGRDSDLRDFGDEHVVEYRNRRHRSDERLRALSGLSKRLGVSQPLRCRKHSRPDQNFRDGPGMKTEPGDYR